ncbi:MAG: antitoxin, RHH family protein [Candidatus Omnitrophica bacterium CG11_big_fil_rev_8_21_14_0_20_64_10]|nr:MAG: antitoxin, RHH family protein [Candidatus Omnitrophica bacterium CG11_big_fil_rev_8_21_14_0_20_64_10]
MATKQPRLNVVLEPSTYGSIRSLSKREGLSMSLVARDLIREALCLYEDAFWSKEAQKREKTFSKRKALKHEQIWA